MAFKAARRQSLKVISDPMRLLSPARISCRAWSSLNVRHYSNGDLQRGFKREDTLAHRPAEGRDVLMVGKSSVTEIVCQQLLGQPRFAEKVVVVSLDDFYLGLRTPEVYPQHYSTPSLVTTAPGMLLQERAHPEDYNFDHPDAFDWDAAKEVLASFKRGLGARIPAYSFVEHSRLPEDTVVKPGVELVLFEGIMALTQEDVRNLLDLKIFVDTDSDICLARRVKRDVVERGRTVEGTLHQYLRFVKPGNAEFVLPSKDFADLVIPLGANPRSVDVLVNYLEKHLVLNEEERKSNRSKKSYM